MLLSPQVRVKQQQRTSLAYRRSVRSAAFTIIELLAVIVVIAILAAISIVAYNGVQTRAASTLLQSDLRSAGTQLGVKQADSGTYPSPSLPSDIKKSESTSFQYTSDGTSYCLTGVSSRSGVPAFMISSDSPSVRQGVCSGHTPPSSGGTIANGDYMQTVTAANCPSSRTMVVDARDSRTYWIQKLADNKCWMLTNLAYAGGGTNTYGDVKTITNSNTVSSTVPYYMIPTGASPTTNPTQPSTSTDGTGQYGYLYNWCAAMGAQTATAACSVVNSASAPDTNVSVCPANWRLPSGNSGGEIQALNSAVNSGLTNTDAGLRNSWQAQRGGYWYGIFYSAGAHGHYWTSTPVATNSNNAYSLYFYSSYVDTGYDDLKYEGRALRCVAV